jgi:hypothetical protein
MRAAPEYTGSSCNQQGHASQAASMSADRYCHGRPVFTSRSIPTQVQHRARACFSHSSHLTLDNPACTQLCLARHMGLPLPCVLRRWLSTHWGASWSAMPSCRYGFACVCERRACTSARYIMQGCWCAVCGCPPSVPVALSAYSLGTIEACQHGLSISNAVVR